MLQVVLIDMIAILMSSAKFTTSDLLKIDCIFSNKGYDVMISVWDIINKILSHESNYIVDMVMW